MEHGGASVTGMIPRGGPLRVRTRARWAAQALAQGDPERLGQLGIHRHHVAARIGEGGALDCILFGHQHRQIFPDAKIPDRCPWGIDNPPPGWSYANLQRQAGLTEFERRASRQGLASAMDCVL